jgi:hypothetical protein
MNYFDRTHHPQIRAHQRAKGGGWYCCSGLHAWFDKADAEKCCDPGWRRVLLVNNMRGAETVRYDEDEGVFFGRKWVRVQ